MLPAKNPVNYRRRAILNRIHGALDAFYLLQRVDWEYDGRATMEKILGLALGEIEFEGGKRIERALIIIEAPSGAVEVEAGWRSEEPARAFSRTVVQETIRSGQPILCENAREDPRFMAAESLKGLTTLSLISMPLVLGGEGIGALYIESSSPGNIFTPEDLEFLGEFTAAIAPYLKAALTHRFHLREIRNLRAAVSERYSFENLIGRSPAMKGVFELMRVAAQGDRTVLITGESGTGKEMVAQAIHYNSARARVPLVVVDCSGLSEHLLESELFGHAKGAFTGASAEKIGAFEEANGGTLFLDEISDAPRSLQQKLRRVLQEGEIRRVGENDYRKVEVRVICATNRSLPEQVEKGEFLRDLYFRVNKLPIHLPPLRERKEDVPPLVHHFIARAQKEVEGVRPRIEGILPEALGCLVERDWPENNIRELRNAVELSVDLAPGPWIDRETVEKVIRIQRGEAIEPEGTGDGSGPPGVTGRSGHSTTGGASLVLIDRERFRAILEGEAKRVEEKGEGSDTDGASPFYRIYLEFAARAIIEGLRASGWKLRPAARLLGVSPMKLRGELKEFLQGALERAGGDRARAARELDIPPGVLEKKAGGFGLESEKSEKGAP